jgi:hypothetical protein
MAQAGDNAGYSDARDRSAERSEQAERVLHAVYACLIVGTGAITLYPRGI